MPEQEDDNRSNNNKVLILGVGERERERAESFMDLDLDFDLDLESSWCLDQISFLCNNDNSDSCNDIGSTTNPYSPVLLTSSDHHYLPCSPLWAFSDGDNNNNNRIATATSAAAGLLFSDYPIFVNCNRSSGSNVPVENDDKRKLPSPLLGLMPVDPDWYCIIKERMSQALRKFKDSTEQHVLAQIWAPVKSGDRYVLTTSGQPFVIDSHTHGLYQYRMVSVMYVFSVDGENEGELGLPGRVFQQKLPEWTPNVQFYSSKEYPRRDHAINSNVQGVLALPVFEPSGQSCVCVLELIMTSQKINYAPEVDKICKALKAVNLKSSEILDHSSTQICNEGRKDALAEILEILTVVCETHKLALAQTWIPCMHRSVLTHGGGLKKSCTSFDGSCNGQVCMSVTNLASYIVDPHVWGFREACLEHHLQKGQGVVGRAFLSHNACFCQDITQFCKTEYPLVHYARLFGLTGCFAICLQSSHTGDDDYVLEFFLPPSMLDGYKQKALLGCLLATMKEHFKSLKVASGMDLEDERLVEIIETSGNGMLDLRLECIQIPKLQQPPPYTITSTNEEPPCQLYSLKHPLAVDVDIVDYGCSTGHVEERLTSTLLESKGCIKPSERKRGKTEKSISMEVLQQHFGGSLKDAAKSLGVCPTTMKRICRQHGISRWPSRKINKVNRSLCKLKRVMESVGGAEGAFDLTPLATSPLPIAVGSTSWPSNHNGCDQQNSPNCKSHQLRGEKNGSPAMGQDSRRIKSRSGSNEESPGTSTSHGSSQGSLANEDASFSLLHEQCIKASGSPELPLWAKGRLILTATNSAPNVTVATKARQPFGEMLIEDSGSSRDLRNLCPPVAGPFLEEQISESSWPNLACQDLPSPQTMAAFKHITPLETANQEIKSVTIKATHKEHIIRFRILMNSGIMKLKEEVAKRLKMEIGTFDIKYLDDDLEWILIACDTDLEECFDISRSSGRNVIRLSVHDINTNPGSSSESTGEL